MFPVLRVGPLAIAAPGLILLIGLWLGLSLAERYSARRGVKPDQLYNMAFAGLGIGLLVARLAYIARYPDAFLPSPISVISLNPALLDPWAGLAAAALTVAIYAKRKYLPLAAVLDAFTPALAVFAIAYHLSTLAAGSAYGLPTGLPWAIELWGESRHPLQIYYTIASGLILWAVWPGRTSQYFDFPGGLFLRFTALTAIAWLFLEAFRSAASILPGNMRQNQVIAWLALAVSLWLLGRGRSDSGETPSPQSAPIQGD